MHRTMPQYACVEQVYLVDDRPSDLRLIQRLCENVGIRTQTFQQVSEFLEYVNPEHHGCLIADLLMPEMSGLDLFTELRRRQIELTTILITGFADASSCRACFHAGVFDFIEKDLSPGELLAVIRRALEHDRQLHADRQIRNSNRDRVSRLTSREAEVAELLSRGRALKEIGAELRISAQTASKHRSSIFEKLEVNNEVELHEVCADCLELLHETKQATQPRDATAEFPVRAGV